MDFLQSLQIQYKNKTKALFLCIYVVYVRKI